MVVAEPVSYCQSGLSTLVTAQSGLSSPWLPPAPLVASPMLRRSRGAAPNTECPYYT